MNFVYYTCHIYGEVNTSNKKNPDLDAYDIHV